MLPSPSSAVSWPKPEQPQVQLPQRRSVAVIGQPRVGFCIRQPFKRVMLLGQNRCLAGAVRAEAMFRDNVQRRVPGAVILKQ